MLQTLNWIKNNLNKTKYLFKKTDSYVCNMQEVVQNNIKYKILCYFLIFSSLFYAIVTGLTLPILDWTIGYYLPNIEMGFIRRSILGTILDLFNINSDIYSVIFIIYAITALTIILVIYSIRFNVLIGTILFVVVFTSEYGRNIFHLSHLGYPEYFLYALTIIILLVNNFILTYFLIILSLFIHEMSIFFMLPIISLNLLLNQKFRHLALLIFSSGMVIVFIYFNKSGSDESYNNLINLLSSLKIDFRLRYLSVFKAYSQIPYANYWNDKIFYYILPIGIFLIISKTNLKNKIFIAGALSSPLFLGFVAWDIWRWDMILL